MARLSLEYIAGFIDAEGSFGIYPRKRDKGTIDWVVHVSVVNTDLKVMMLIAEVLGGTIRIQENNRLGTKTVYALRWSHRQARDIANKLYPYLVVKKDKAKIIKDFPACSGTFTPIDMENKKQEQENLYIKFRQLNGKAVV